MVSAVGYERHTNGRIYWHVWWMSGGVITLHKFSPTGVEPQILWRKEVTCLIGLYLKINVMNNLKGFHDNCMFQDMVLDNNNKNRVNSACQIMYVLSISHGHKNDTSSLYSSLCLSWIVNVIAFSYRYFPFPQTYYIFEIIWLLVKNTAILTKGLYLCLIWNAEWNDAGQM